MGLNLRQENTPEISDEDKLIEKADKINDFYLTPLELEQYKAMFDPILKKDN